MRKKADENIFVEATIHLVAKVGIENLRTKQIAEETGFSEAALFHYFDSKDDVLRAAFLLVDKRVSDLLINSPFVKNPEDYSLTEGIHEVWHKVYRYLLRHKEEALFLIRFRYSALYSKEVRGRRQAYSGGFERAYRVMEGFFGTGKETYRGFLVNYIFEMTLCFAEKIISGRMKNTKETEEQIWRVIQASVREFLPEAAPVAEKSAPEASCEE